MSDVLSTDPNSADFLKPAASGTLDGGGATGTGVTDDYQGATRASTPSIGAFEVDGAAASSALLLQIHDMQGIGRCAL